MHGRHRPLSAAAAPDWKRGLAFALVTVLMWGALPLGLKEVLGRMDPPTITWYRFSISAIIALAWYGWRSDGALRAMLMSRRAGWALTAVFGLLGNYLLFAWGLDHLNPGAAQIIVQVAPLLLLLASILFLGERVDALDWLGVAGALFVVLGSMCSTLTGRQPRHAAGPPGGERDLRSVREQSRQ